MDNSTTDLSEKPLLAALLVPESRIERERFMRYNGYTMFEWNTCPQVERVPGKVGGAWLFKGTRVPVRALFENLEDGATVDQFIEWFPGVGRSQIEAVLGHTAASLAVETME